jgi:H/ACA ribonucleoprotein complex subunit 3
MKHILMCSSCKSYTIKELCPKCGGKTGPSQPPKYSPEDKYAKYRREAKLEERRKEGLL